ncbi:hypothetical protein [Butyrivibrio sp. AE2032]|uniref:hypothetical protein n=1 Tax=Butyrivibrio sp. AE2032 TaxID=1458463 RepID=UPI000550D32E|nr:hypothetical protein [Butyrivibrio sp. AE2032]
MGTSYDMCIDYETLCELESKLINISNNLGVSADSMLFALRNCDGFLSGNQFEKASQTTITCSEVSKKTIENISEVLKYITKLKECLETYSGCRYSE